MTLNEFVESKFWPYCQKLRRSTVVGYESAYFKHIKPRFGDYALEEITVEDIELWLGSFVLTGAAKKAYAVLRCILRKAYKWQHCKFDPTVLNVEVPKRPKYRPQVLSDAQMANLLRAVYGHEVEPIVICSMSLGLRRGESCGLKWGDIDLRSGHVYIYKSRQYIAREVRIEGVKTDESNRMLTLPKFALKRLRELAKGRTKDEWLCPLSPDAIARKYKALCKRESIPYVPLKNLRHSYATSCIRAGVPIDILAHMLGHSETSTTEKYYLVTDERLFKSAQAQWESKFLKSASNNIIEFAA